MSSQGVEEKQTKRKGTKTSTYRHRPDWIFCPPPLRGHNKNEKKKHFSIGEKQMLIYISWIQHNFMQLIYRMQLIQFIKLITPISLTQLIQLIQLIQLTQLIQLISSFGSHTHLSYFVNLPQQLIEFIQHIKLIWLSQLISMIQLMFSSFIPLKSMRSFSLFISFISFSY